MMRFTVFTHAEHFQEKKKLYSYSPYVREMNIWLEKVDEVTIVAPLKNEKNEIDEFYDRKDIELQPVKSVNFVSLKNTFISFFKIPGILRIIYMAMIKTDHIHIRCPGNIGLLAAILQVFFPSKKKTVKYAGNWDPKSKQPLSYRFQRWILKNQFLTRNAKVLVYGNWYDQGKNIIPFFTASYSKNETAKILKNFNSPYNFVFVGSLVTGKRPLFVVQVIQRLKKLGVDVHLDIFGDGECRQEISDYIRVNHLEMLVKLHGNQNPEVVKKAYYTSHFSILPSKSEGWPKALAEAMFFGCIPIGTRISCVPWMLGNGSRGVLIEPTVKSAAKEISDLLKDSCDLMELSKNAQKWSRNFNLEEFKYEIHKFL